MPCTSAVSKDYPSLAELLLLHMLEMAIAIAKGFEGIPFQNNRLIATSRAYTTIAAQIPYLGPLLVEYK